MRRSVRSLIGRLSSVCVDCLLWGTGLKNKTKRQINTNYQVVALPHVHVGARTDTGALSIHIYNYLLVMMNVWAMVDWRCGLFKIICSHFQNNFHTSVKILTQRFCYTSYMWGITVYGKNQIQCAPKFETSGWTFWHPKLSNWGWLTEHCNYQPECREKMSILWAV